MKIKINNESAEIHPIKSITCATTKRMNENAGAINTAMSLSNPSVLHLNTFVLIKLIMQN